MGVAAQHSSAQSLPFLSASRTFCATRRLARHTNNLAPTAPLIKSRHLLHHFGACTIRKLSDTFQASISNSTCIGHFSAYKPFSAHGGVVFIGALSENSQSHL